MVRAPPRSCAKRPVGAATVTRARGDPQGFRPRVGRPRRGRNRLTGLLRAGTRLRTVAAAGEDHGERRSARSSRSRRVLPPPRREVSRAGRRPRGDRVPAVDGAGSRGLSTETAGRAQVEAPGRDERRPDAGRERRFDDCQSWHRVETSAGRAQVEGAGSMTAGRGPGRDECRDVQSRSTQVDKTVRRGAARDASGQVEAAGLQPRRSSLGRRPASANRRARNCERLAGGRAASSQK